MGDGKFVTEIFAKQMIGIIDGMDLTFYPSRFSFGCGDRNSSYECKAKDCHKAADGRWVTNHNTAHDGRSREPVAPNRFLWRIEPNYCIHGKPFFSAQQIADIFARSETKKVIHETNRHSVCLEWFKFDYPTDNIWGLRQGPVHITVWEHHNRIWTGKKSIRDRGWKKEFTEYIMEYFKWDPSQGE